MIKNKPYSSTPRKIRKLWGSSHDIEREVTDLSDIYIRRKDKIYMKALPIIYLLRDYQVKKSDWEEIEFDIKYKYSTPSKISPGDLNIYYMSDFDIFTSPAVWARVYTEGSNETIPTKVLIYEKKINVNLGQDFPKNILPYLKFNLQTNIPKEIEGTAFKNYNRYFVYDFIEKNNKLYFKGKVIIHNIPETEEGVNPIDFKIDFYIKVIHPHLEAYGLQKSKT